MEPSTIPSSSIVADSTTILESDAISASNRLKWANEGKSYMHTYDEVAAYTKYSNVLDATPDRLLTVILELYFQTKTLDVSNTLIKESILKLLKSIEHNTEVGNKREFVCKLESFIDYIRSYDQ